MCCTQKEMAAEGKSPDPDTWYTVKHVPCCVPEYNEATGTPLSEALLAERETAIMDTGVQCGRCNNDTLRLLRVVRTAEQHGGEELPVPLAECACPCGNKTTFVVSVLEELARAKGVTLNVPEE